MWTPRSLLGDVDFHALVVAEGRLYGADSTSARVLVSDDGGQIWEARTGDAQLLDLGVDPTDPDRMAGADLDRGLIVSDDGGNSWEPVAGAPQLIHLEWTSRSLVGIDAEGAIMTSTDDGVTSGTGRAAAPCRGSGQRRHRLVRLQPACRPAPFDRRRRVVDRGNPVGRPVLLGGVGFVTRRRRRGRPGVAPSPPPRPPDPRRRRQQGRAHPGGSRPSGPLEPWRWRLDGAQSSSPGT